MQNALSGVVRCIDMQLQFIDLRPGDKLHEELLTQSEGIRTTRHKKIFIARPDAINTDDLSATLDTLQTLADQHDRPGIIRKLQDIVPDYCPSPLWKTPGTTSKASP